MTSAAATRRYLKWVRDMEQAFALEDGSSCTIRMAGEGDGQGIYRLVCELEEQAFDYDEFFRRFCAQLADPRMRCLVLEVAGDVAGYLNLRIDQHLHHVCPTAEILEFIVGPAVRGGGIGTKMFACARKIAEAEGCEELEVSSKLTRVDAHRFYERQGMVKTHACLTMRL